MDVSALESAYDRFLDVARGSRDMLPPAGEWPPELVLAHVIVGDRLIAETAARVISGGQPRFDNRASQSAPYLEAIARAAGSWDALLARVRQGGEELMTTVTRIEPEHARISVPSFVMDGDHIVVDRPAPLEELVMVPALIHLPGHAEQLKSYSR